MEARSGNERQAIISSNRSPASGAEVVTKVDRVLVTEAGKTGSLIRQIESEVGTVLDHLEDRLRSTSARTVSQWQEIHEGLEKTVKDIRRLVTYGRTKARDTFETFARQYLPSSSDSTVQKLKEIDNLTKDLRKDGLDALLMLKSVHDALDQAKTAIHQFDRHWAQDGPAFLIEIKPHTQSVEKNIGFLLRGKHISRTKNYAGMGLGETLTLFRSSFPLDEKEPNPLHNSGSRIEHQLETVSSLKDTISMLDILLSLNNMLYNDINNLIRQFDEYCNGHDKVAFGTIYKGTRELYQQIEKAFDEFTKSYNEKMKSFCGPCGSRVNADLGAGLDTHHTGSRTQKQVPKLSLIAKIVRFFKGT